MTEESKPKKKPYFRTKGPCKSYTKEWMQEMTDSLNEWAKLDDACSFIGWLALEGMDYAKCERLADEYPDFAKAKKKALFTIGYRRELNALNGDWDGGTVRKSMALYDPMMKKHELEMKGHDIAAKAAAQVAITNFSGMAEILDKIEALEKRNAELEAQLDA